MRAGIWIGAALCLLVAAPAEARTFVVYGPGVDATTATAKAQEALGDADIRVAGPINDWIGVADDQPVVVGATVLRCADGDRRKRPLKGYLVGIEASMADMSYGDALRNIDLVIEKLPCLAEGAAKDDIYTLFFLQGVARYFEDDLPGAEQSFAAAAAVAPGRDWPSDWPPTPQPVYLRALQAVNAQPPAALDAEIEGQVFLDGVADEATPRLHMGGHLLWLPETETGMWIEVPPSNELPEDGVLITTGGQLREGLMTAQERYAPWLAAVAEKEAWEDVVLVSPDGAVRYQGGVFTPLGSTGRRLAARARRAAKADSRLQPPAIGGLVTLGVGAAVTVVGVGLNLSAYQSGLPRQGTTLMPRTDYEALAQRNKVGLGVALGGGVTAAAGAIITMIGVSLPPGTVAALPYFSADEHSVAFGFSGRF